MNMNGSLITRYGKIKMPRIHMEEVPGDLLVHKPRYFPECDKLPKKLRYDVASWTHDNCSNHWFLTKEEVKISDPGGYGNPGHYLEDRIFINFTCEFDAAVWKLRWL